MKMYGCDVHKKYSMFAWIDDKVASGPYFRVSNEFKEYLRSIPESSVIALKTMGNWYWMVDEIERAGHKPGAGQCYQGQGDNGEGQ
ncbi:MAG: hypothetical protein H5U06_05470 [Candidatus Aminicenantes bacterium]|nr:hypothetical protein [Candidatus Aminicenantes bacterium]